MTRGRLLARAVAYNASRSERFYRDLGQHDLQTFWPLVNNLRTVAEQRRTQHMFWQDQASQPQVLP